jgi:hypothetical protein
MVTALEGGITYWCGEARVKKHFEPKEEYTYLSDVITRGGVLELWDSEEEKWVNLDLHRLVEALGKLHFPFEDYDAGDVDSVIQQAVFGEVIYG